MDVMLTSYSRLPKESILFLNRTALEIRNEYNKVIEQIGKKYTHSIDWWVSELASRNTFTNDLFLNMAYLGLVNQLVNDKNNHISSITVESKELAKVLNNSALIKENLIKIIIKISFQEHVKYFCRPFYSFIYSLWHITRLYVCTKIMKERKPFDISKDITLIDNFIFDNSISNSDLIDRYYDKFNGMIDKEEYKRIYFTPTFINITSYKDVIKNIRNSKDNILLKEDYLKLNDWLFAFFYPMRSIKFKPRNIYFRGYNIKPLLNKIWKDNVFDFGAFDPLLKYRFAKRLKERDIKIRLVIDWFENQSIDKGFNAGFRKYYPETTIVGYQVAMDAKYPLCSYPTSFELMSNVLPHRIAVSGRAFIDPVKEFCKELTVEVAPAFRYQHVWRKRLFYPESAYFTVLLILPITPDDARGILELAMLTAKECIDKKVRFWIKEHPSWISSHPANYYKKLPVNFTFVEGKLDDILESSDVIIGNNSSAVLESLARGIPAIVIGNRSTLTINPIPATVDNRIWKMCFDEIELRDAINIYSHSNKIDYEEIGIKIREDYFARTDDISVRHFFRLEQN
jgi:hypothetical protein